jgi:hypothetical protein
MKRYLLVMWVGLAGCAPKYSDGKTQCSDKLECPSGYSCSDDGSGATHYCFENKSIGCPDTSILYCSQSGTCQASRVVCPGAVGGGSGGVTGAGGTGGRIILPGQGGGGGLVSGLRDAGLVNRDAGSVATCTPACPASQQCLSGQCCAPPATGGACSVLPACGCPSDQVCYPSFTSHAMACYDADNLAEGADCRDGRMCQAGFGCFGGLCKRYCSTVADCPTVGGVRSCEQTTWSSDDSDILGVKVCERVCDPAHPQSPVSPLSACPRGFGCASDANGLSYCLATAPLAAGLSCTQESDCNPGYYCSVGGDCTRYCMSNSDCLTGTICQFTWDPPEYAGAYEIGYCQ